MCELLNTVSLLKSDSTKEIIKDEKLTTTKKNCKKVNDNIFELNILEFLKFFTEKKTRSKLTHKPSTNE